MTMKLVNILTVGLLLAAGNAAAQSYSQVNTNSGLTVMRGTYTSVTTVSSQVGINPISTRPVRVTLQSNSTPNVFVLTELSDGTILSSQTVVLAANVPQTVTFAPTVNTHGFEGVRISPSVALTGSNVVTSTVLQ